MEEKTLQDILTKENAILINDISENPTLEKWQEMGQPKVLILSDEWQDYQLYDDIAYGIMYLLKNGKIVDMGRTFVQDPSMPLVGLGPYYEYEKPTLFVKPVKEERSK